MEDKITIIEGPPPLFERVDDGWVLGLFEGAAYTPLSMTRLRTFNGPALVERCHRAWNHKLPMYLIFKNKLGLEQSAPILAARASMVDEEQLLFLWVAHKSNEGEHDDLA
jgi:hypothetical protein